MKKRLIIYSVLLVVAAGTIYYVALNRQAPTGHGYGNPIPAYVGKIIAIEFYDREQILYFGVTARDSGRFQKFFCSTSSPMVPMIAMAFQSQSTCSVFGFENRDLVEATKLLLLEPPKGEEKGEKKGTDLEKEIKEMKNYIYWIWHYVWNISRRLR